MKLPNFICVGVQKSGTTWLYNELSKRPEIEMPKTKEIGNEKFSTGVEKIKVGIKYPFLNLEKYSSYLPQNEKITGDITPAYFYDKNCARQIKEKVPNAFVFVILRNPIDRAFSQWRMDRNLSLIKKEYSFFNYFTNNTNYSRERGLYIDYIRYFVEELSSNFEVYFYDELLKDPNDFLRKILKKIKIEANECKTSWLEMPYSNDKQKIEAEDYEMCRRFYKKSILKLENFLKTNTNWTKNKIM